MPPKFKSWRRNQEQAISDGLESTKRFVAHAMHLGGGKTGVYVAQAMLSRRRTMILTSTKALQSQILADFKPLGMVEMKGKSSYRCCGIPSQTCEEGMIGGCPFAHGDMHLCTWGEAKMIASSANLVTTNYACWTAANRYANGFGHFDMLVLDEAHNAEEALAKALRVTITVREVGHLGKEIPDCPESMEAWVEWANAAHMRADIKLQALIEKGAKNGGKYTDDQVQQYKRLSDMIRKFATLSLCHPPDWVVDICREPMGFQFDPKDIGQFAESTLFRNIERVGFFSGTIRPRIRQLLGINEEDFEFFDYPTALRKDRSPLYFVPTAYVSRKSFDKTEDLDRIVKRVDEIVESRADRRGIIHTANFKMCEYILEHSKYGKYMLSNREEETHKVIHKFKNSPLPTVLVSPSVHTGYDFPDAACRYQVIAKLPYPDTFSSKIEQERSKLDPLRGIHQMWQNLAQAFGRGDRGESDWQEVICIDNNIEREMWEHRDLAPPWLPLHYQKVMEVPQPTMFDED